MKDVAMPRLYDWIPFFAIYLRRNRFKKKKVWRGRAESNRRPRV
jgi:hypothetical protein